MPNKIFDDVMEKALKDLAKMRGISKEQIINEALFWYLNFLGSRVEQMNDIQFNLNDRTIEKIAQRVAELIKQNPNV